MKKAYGITPAAFTMWNKDESFNEQAMQKYKCLRSLIESIKNAGFQSCWLSRMRIWHWRPVTTATLLKTEKLFWKEPANKWKPARRLKRSILAVDWRRDST